MNGEQKDLFLQIMRDADYGSTHCIPSRLVDSRELRAAAMEFTADHCRKFSAPLKDAVDKLSALVERYAEDVEEAEEEDDAAYVEALRQAEDLNDLIQRARAALEMIR